MLRNTLLLLLCLFPSFLWAKDSQHRACERIVSLAPSITDTLDALGLSTKIVGFTRYCELPKTTFLSNQPEIIGGYLDINLEKIIAVDPDIIFNIDSSSISNTLALKKFNFNVVTFPQNNLKDIENSVLAIADACGIPEKGNILVQKFQQDLNHLRNKITQQILKNENKQKSEKNIKKRILILYGYDQTKNGISGAYGAGPSFHADLLELLGAQNAYEGKLPAPLLSQESILEINPDIIFILKNDATSDAHFSELKYQKIEPDWGILNQITALKKNQVYEIIGRDSFMPSIRISHLAKILADLIYDL